jgi:hypothetical protein
LAESCEVGQRYAAGSLGLPGCLIPLAKFGAAIKSAWNRQVAWQRWRVFPTLVIAFMVKVALLFLIVIELGLWLSEKV